MKREKLSKGKRIDNDEWIEGSFVKTFYNSFIIPMNDETVRAMEIVSVYEDSVCDFTGKTDKKRIKIFEGDFDADGNIVLWCENCNGWEFGALDIPTNEICIACHRCDGNFFFEDHINDFEAIGNIYQNDPTNTCEAF